MVFSLENRRRGEIALFNIKGVCCLKTNLQTFKKIVELEQLLKDALRHGIPIRKFERF